VSIKSHATSRKAKSRKGGHRGGTGGGKRRDHRKGRGDFRKSVYFLGKKYLVPIEAGTADRDRVKEMDWGGILRGSEKGNGPGLRPASETAQRGAKYEFVA